MNGEFESRSASRITERKANNVSQPVSGFVFLTCKCCERPNCTSRELSASGSQSTSKILSRHPFSQMNHLLEPPRSAVMCKATSLPPPNPKYVPCIWRGTSVFELSFYRLHLIVVFQI